MASVLGMVSVLARVLEIIFFNSFLSFAFLDNFSSKNEYVSDSEKGQTGLLATGCYIWPIGRSESAYSSFVSVFGFCFQEQNAPFVWAISMLCIIVFFCPSFLFVFAVFLAHVFVLVCFVLYFMSLRTALFCLASVLFTSLCSAAPAPPRAPQSAISEVVVYGENQDAKLAAKAEALVRKGEEEAFKEAGEKGSAPDGGGGGGAGREGGGDGGGGGEGAGLGTYVRREDAFFELFW